MSGPGTGFNPDEFGATKGGTAADQQRAPIKRSKSDLLAEIDRLGKADTGKSAEDLFKEGMAPGRDPLQGFKDASTQAGVDTKVPGLVEEYLSNYGPKGSKGSKGSVSSPGVIQDPSEKSLFNSYQEAALGPAPDLLFRDVFKEHFGDFDKMRGPFDKFVENQAKELENRFMTEQFKNFNQPGVMDSLRGDFENLSTNGKGNSQGTGESIPAFSDYIKSRVTGNFSDYLQGEKPKLEQAFQLASPSERGQKDEGQLAPDRRIL